MLVGKPLGRLFVAALEQAPDKLQLEPDVVIRFGMQVGHLEPRTALPIPHVERLALE